MKVKSLYFIASLRFTYYSHVLLEKRALSSLAGLDARSKLGLCLPQNCLFSALRFILSANILTPLQGSEVTDLLREKSFKLQI